MGSFNFDVWLKQNELLDYKKLFIQYEMTTIDTISTSSTNYSELLSNSQIVSDPLLISKIALTVNNLQTAYKELADNVVAEMEKKLEELTKYEQCSQFPQTSNVLLFNHKMYELEKNKDEKQLNEIRLKIQNLFLSIYKMLKEKEQIILKRFKNVQQEILSKYNKIIEKMQKNDDDILAQKEYLNQHINLFKHNIKEKDTMCSVFEVRDFVQYKIDKNIKKNDTKIRKLVNEKQQILDSIQLKISEDTKQCITENIERLINFEQIQKSNTLNPSSLQSMQSKSYNADSTRTNPPNYTIAKRRKSSDNYDEI